MNDITELLNVDLYNNVRDAILVADTNRRIIHCNSAFSKLFGYNKGEIYGKKTHYIYNDKSEFEQMGSLIKKNIGNTEFVHVVHYRKKDGKVFPGETNVFYLKDSKGEIRGIVGLIRDITEKRKLKKEIYAKEEKFGKIFNNIQDPVFIQKFSHKILDPSFIEVNYAAVDMLGYSIQEFKELNPGKILAMSPARAEKILNKMKKEGSVLFETELIGKHGDKIPVEINSMHFDLNQVPVILSVIRDITYRKRYKKALQKSEYRYRSIFENAVVAIIIIDSFGKIKSWNKSAGKLFGYDFKEVKNKGLKVIIPSQYRERHEKGLTRLRETNKGKLIGNTVEYTALKRNGTEFPVELSISSWKIGKETFYTGIIRDISEKKINEEKIKNWNIELEDQVRQRTRELEDTNQQLERMNKLFVGREFRIKELKERIKELEIR